MNRETFLNIIRSLIAGFAIYCVAYTVQGQMTSFKLPTGDTTSGFEVTRSDGTSLFKVSGNGAITGDGSGLSNVRPIAAYSGGNFAFALTSTAQIVKYVTITVPSSGVIIVNTTGYSRWSSTDDDVYRLSITTGSDIDYDYLSLGTDYACPDSSDQYAPISLTRGYTVGSGGTYRYNLVGDNPTWALGFGNSIVQLFDVSMTAMYFPTGGVGAGKVALPEEKMEIPPGPGIDTPRM